MPHPDSHLSRDGAHRLYVNTYQQLQMIEKQRHAGTLGIALDRDPLARLWRKNNHEFCTLIVRYPHLLH